MSYRCGYVALVGRPNVGKSTLANCLVGQKISITAHHPHTTRYRILGIHSGSGFQAIYVDTPGLCQPGKFAISRYLRRTAQSVLTDGFLDVILHVVAGNQWNPEDDLVLEIIQQLDIPVVLVVNKIDLVKPRDLLLPHLEKCAAKYNFVQIVPLSALHNDNVATLEKAIIPLLPEGAAQFPTDQITDRSMRFYAAELLREKLARHLGAELPYAITCEVEQFREEHGVTHISVIIWVERPGQKAIVIGKNGAVLKKIGQEARADIERQLAGKVFLQTWVRVRTGWTNNDRALQSLGYE